MNTLLRCHFFLSGDNSKYYEKTCFFQIWIQRADVLYSSSNYIFELFPLTLKERYRKYINLYKDVVCKNNT